jgi:hypothetical protein
MSETTSSPSAEPGAAVVSPWPNVTEVPEPGGVNWTMRRPSIGATSRSRFQALIEFLGSVDVGHRDDHDLELHVDPPDARVAACVVYVGGAHRYLLICVAVNPSCAAASPIPLLTPVIRIFLSASLPIVVTPLD